MQIKWHHIGAYFSLCMCVCVFESVKYSLHAIILALWLISVHAIRAVLWCTEIHTFPEKNHHFAVIAREKEASSGDMMFPHLNYLVKANYDLHYVIDKLCWDRNVVTFTPDTLSVLKYFRKGIVIFAPNIRLRHLLKL